jgi:hypothetical protein
MGRHLGFERLRIIGISESEIPSVDRRDFFMRNHVDDFRLSGSRKAGDGGFHSIKAVLNLVMFLPLGEVTT